MYYNARERKKLNSAETFILTWTLKTFHGVHSDVFNFSLTMHWCNKGCPWRYSKEILQLFGCLSRWQTHQKEFHFWFLLLHKKSFAIFSANLYANVKVTLRLKGFVGNYRIRTNNSYATQILKTLFDLDEVQASIFTRFYSDVDIFICTISERSSMR